jgi:DNA uptake protein ComE-like DNA-binding protein
MSNNKQQTAVEYLIHHIRQDVFVHSKSTKEWNQVFQQAKKMDKEQKKECWDVAHQAGRFEGKGIAEKNWQTFEQYYEQTYGGGEQ